jgi:molybdopterin synthase catalytic subunit
MVIITREPISPELSIDEVKTASSGCVVTYIGVIRNLSDGKPVMSVEYEDPDGVAESRLGEIVSEVKLKWQLEGVAICHRIGELKVGDINLVVAVAAAHRDEGFAASQYIIDRFKQKLTTKKRETYTDVTWAGNI